MRRMCSAAMILAVILGMTMILPLQQEEVYAASSGLNVRVLHMQAGQSFKLKLKTSKNVKWKSSNKKRAKVTGLEDGTCLIKAGKKTGKVRITAVTASGRKVIFKLRIQSSKVKTKKIRIEKRTVRISVGEMLALEPVLYPVTSVQKITYKSRNEWVAAVSKEGVIKGIAAGTTKVVISSGTGKIKVKVIVS